MTSAVSEVRNCLCLNARRVARHLTQAYDEALRPSGLRVTQFQLLAAVDRTESATQQVLSEAMGMDRTTLTRNLALLRRNGLVEIQIGREDRREHRHLLTAKGRKAVAKAMPMWQCVQERLVQHVTAGKAGETIKNAKGLLWNLGSFAG